MVIINYFTILMFHLIEMINKSLGNAKCELSVETRKPVKCLLVASGLGVFGRSIFFSFQTDLL